jgi:hypothetical protein
MPGLCFAGSSHDFVLYDKISEHLSGQNHWTITKSLEKPLTARAFCKYNPSIMNIDLRTQLNKVLAWYFYFSPPA